jgi:hypothetical protein
VTAPQPAADASPLLDLARQYGDAREEYAEVLRTRSNEEGLDRYAASVNALFDRIAALAPTLPVQARDEFGIALFIHACGYVLPESVQGVAAGEHHCFPPCPKPGPWRPLLVGGDPAPEPRCSACGSVNPPGGCNIHCPTIVIAQVMATLGVDRPEDVPRAVKDLWADHLLVENASRRAVEWMQQRDEARAEVERLTATLEASLGRCRCRICHELPELSEASPPAQPDPLVLRLPEVPEGAVALVGVRSGRRYPFHEESGGWRNDDGEGAPWKLSAVLHREQPEGVRVEIVPPREPRTAAEIWRAFSNDDRRRLVNTAELADALDREAGLNMDGGQS